MSYQGYIVIQTVTFWVTVGFFLPSCNFFPSNLQNVLIGFWDFPGQVGWDLEQYGLAEGVHAHGMEQYDL